MHSRRFVLLGPPGAGKGTHGANLGRYLTVPHIATGDMLRKIIETDDTSILAQQVRVIEKGQLIPDSLMNALLFRNLNLPEAAQGWILDGYPRTLPQAEELNGFLAVQHQKLDGVIALDVTEATVLDRLSGRLTCLHCGASYHVRNEPPKVVGICDNCGHELTVREDDRPDRVRVRLKLYAERTEPLLRYYDRIGCLHRVQADAIEPIAFAAIRAIVDTILVGAEQVG